MPKRTPLTKWCLCHGDDRTHYFTAPDGNPICGKRLVQKEQFVISPWGKTGPKSNASAHDKCRDCKRKHWQMWRENIMPL